MAELGRQRLALCRKVTYLTTQTVLGMLAGDFAAQQ
jgi:hypothetical protein